MSSLLMAHFFLVLNNIPLSAVPQFIYAPPTSGHLGPLHVLVIMNEVAVNLCAQVLSWDFNWLMWHCVAIYVPIHI